MLNAAFAIAILDLISQVHLPSFVNMIPRCLKDSAYLVVFFLGWGVYLDSNLVRSQLVSLEFFIDTKFFRSHYGPGVDSASNRNEYQEHFLGVKAAGA